MATDTTNMQRRNFFLPNKVFEALKAKADKSGTPMSEHVRAALIAYLKIDESAA